MSAKSEHYRTLQQKFTHRADRSAPSSAPLWLEIAQTYRLLAENEEQFDIECRCMIPQPQ
jgi:hypothetical protein